MALPSVMPMPFQRDVGILAAHGQRAFHLRFVCTPRNLSLFDPKLSPDFHQARPVLPDNLRNTSPAQASSASSRRARDAAARAPRPLHASVRARAVAPKILFWCRMRNAAANSGSRIRKLLPRVRGHIGVEVRVVAEELSVTPPGLMGPSVGGVLGVIALTSPRSVPRAR